MKKSKVLAATMAALAFSSVMTSCDDDTGVADEQNPSHSVENYEPQQDVTEDVYGPPPSDEIDVSEEYIPEEDDFVCVYGPPSYFEESGEEE